MNNGGRDLRIYYGEARIIVPGGDERIGRMLAMAHEGPLKPLASPHPRMLCWMHRRDTGDYSTPIWLPEGQTPVPAPHRWQRAPWLDEP